ncbi:MAG: SusC/RagA family TonB-linked outer membrane protein [Lacibacter sp.]|nr:SusC/RagA family TonB-linked outer membrane protein [Lacibacter sp.]
MKLKPGLVKCVLLSHLLLFGAVLPILAQNNQENPDTKQAKVSGKVTDEKDSPVSGVSIQVKGGNVIAVTDNDGNFSVTVANGTVLQFTSTGYGVYEYVVKKAETISVKLGVDAKSMEDVVVVGYGTQKKRAVTGSVVSVGYEQFKDRSFSNVAQSLAGSIPGVNITSSQGAPGFGPTIKIRGTSSLTAGSTPLYVVDGMALENFDLNLINPQDIQSVDILKDAASSAIYGSRGANGVILITTKLGRSGKPQVNLSYEYGLSHVNRKVDMMDAQQWINYYIDARNNAWVLLDPVNNRATDDNTRRASAGKNYLIPPDFLTNPAQFGKGTDWQDAVFRTASTTNAQLSINGGTDKTSYLFSLGYLNQEAVVIKNFYKRLVLRSNIRQKVSDHITAGLNLSFTGAHDRTDGTTGKSDAISLAIQSDPIFPEYNENGNLGFLDPNSTWKRFQTYGVQLWNPHSLIDYADKLNKTYNTLANAYLEIKPVKDLLVKGSLSGNLTSNNYNWYWVSGQGYGYSSVLPAQASARNSLNLNWQAEATATYTKKIGEHSIGAIAGYSSQKNRYEGTNVNATNFPNDLVRTINAAGTVTKAASGNSTE